MTILFAAILALFPLLSFAATAQGVFSGTAKPDGAATVTPAPSAPALSDEVRALEAEVKKKREALDLIQKQIEIYQKSVEVKQGERVTLQRQLGVIEENVTRTNLDIEATKQELAITNLEIKKVNRELEQLNTEAEKQRAQLRVLLELIREEGERNPMEYLFRAQNFSEFFDAVSRSEQLAQGLLRVLDRLKELSAQSNAHKEELQAKERKKKAVELSLRGHSARLAEDRETKEYLVAKTQESEKKFQQFLEQARAEEEQADADIRAVEKKIREKLAAQPPEAQRLGVGETIAMLWPVPFQGIAAYFHDPSYIFRRIFEHPAVDLRTLVGGRPTNGQPVRAAASGYVGRARDGGMGYSYIMLLHTDRISTVYGHVSKILVRPEQYVSQGDVIALSGGLPGTPGAGRLTTGPHLHFEVRLDGIPVNPLNYLPSM